MFTENLVKNIMEAEEIIKIHKENMEILISEIENIKEKVIGFFYMNFSKRPVEKAYLINGKFYQDQNGSIPLNPDAYYVYEIHDANTKAPYYADGNNLSSVSFNYSAKFRLNGAEIDLNEIKSYRLDGIESVNSLSLDIGVMAELSYQV